MSPADGALEPLDHRALADQAVPHACASARRVIARTASSSGASRACTASAISSTGGAGVEHQVVVGIGRRQPQELRRARAGGTRSTRASIRSRPSNRVSPAAGLEVEQHGQVGAQVLGGPAGDPLELGAVERTAGALVGERRVDVAVGDHDLAPLERRTDDRVDVLGLVGGVQQRLGAVGQLAGRRVQHDPAYLRRRPGCRRARGSAVRRARRPRAARAAAGTASTCRPLRRPRSRRTRPSGVDAGEPVGHGLTLEGGDDGTRGG